MRAISLYKFIKRRDRPHGGLLQGLRSSNRMADSTPTVLQLNSLQV